MLLQKSKIEFELVYNKKSSLISLFFLLLSFGLIETFMLSWNNWEIDKELLGVELAWLNSKFKLT